MDITHILSVLFMMYTQTKPGVSQVQLNTNGAITAVLGNNAYHLTCTHSGLTPSQIQGLALKLLKDGQWIMVLPPFYAGMNETINAKFSIRTSVDRFTAENSTTTVTFQSIECADEGTYSWEGSYLDEVNGQTLVTQTQDITVKALPVFGQDVSQVSFTPNTNLAVGDKVTFTCSGDVGNNPVGVIAWYYYTDGGKTPIDESSNAISTAPQLSRVCSRSRSSTLELTLTRDMDRMVVRCTVQQNMQTPDGEGYIQTDSALSVKYKPEIRSLKRYPDLQLYPEGLEQLQISCYAEGNPPPGNYWLFNNSTRAGNGSLVLNNLTAAQGGTYTCVAYNYIKGVLQNVYASTDIVIQVTTANSFSTSTKGDSTTPPKETETLKKGTTCESKPGFGVGMIVGIVIGAFLVGAVGITVMLARRFHKRRKVPEQQHYINTELNTSSEQSTANTRINKYDDDVNGDGTEHQYQSLRHDQSASDAGYLELDVLSLRRKE